jgi:hypothetical protein
LCAAAGILACEASSKKSADEARGHVERLVEVVTRDVAEVRSGLPQGAKLLAEGAYAAGQTPESDLVALPKDLHRTRAKVQDLRVAKSTFFALIGEDGVVLRSDQEHDLMTGKSFLQAFPAAKSALTGRYTEAVGSMYEARGVEGKQDGQWIAAAPIAVKDRVRGCPGRPGAEHS